MNFHIETQVASLSDWLIVCDFSSVLLLPVLFFDLDLVFFDFVIWDAFGTCISFCVLSVSSDSGCCP